MTVCVYYNDKLVADSQVTLGQVVEFTHYNKTGFIYKDSVSGVMSLTKDSDTYKEYAMFAFAGLVKYLTCFLDWFFCESDSDFELFYTKYGELDLDEMECMVIFREKSLIHIYDNEFHKNFYIAVNKEQPVIIGSGGDVIRSILSYDPQADLYRAIQVASKLNITCGGDIKTLQFTETIND